MAAGPVAAEPEAQRRDEPSRPASGRLITFEGLEGTGKSTQIARLARRLGDRGLEVVVTREPGATELGRSLRRLLLRPDLGPIGAWAELLLYVADRAQHLEELIVPALEAGKVVLCDRYVDATVAYQGWGRGIGAGPILDLHRRAPLDRAADRTILLDLDEAAALGRARGRDRSTGMDRKEGRFESEGLEFHRRVRAGYLDVARRAPARVRVVDATGTPAEVERRIRESLEDLLPC